MRLSLVLLTSFMSLLPASAEEIMPYRSFGFQSQLPQLEGFITAALPPLKIEKKLPAGGETFRLFGKTGELVLYRGKDSLEMALTLKNKENYCSVDLTPSAPVNMSYAGKPNGVPRYYSKLQGCDVFVDLLPDAALLLGGSCKATPDCAVEVSGLWGAQAIDLPLEKTFEKKIGISEKRMNEARKLLTKKLGNSQIMRDFLSEHLDFNANRRTSCEEYGTGASWCSLKLTEFRINTLETQLQALK